MQSNFWAGSKNFGPAQNILGPVKGQGIHLKLCENLTVMRLLLEVSH
jgi:hypothetical protein